MNIIEERNNEVNDDFQRPKIPKWKQILHNKIFIGLVVVVCLGTVVPVLIYYFVIDKGTYAPLYEFSCSVDEISRIQCGQANATSSYCESINCCFDDSKMLCYHFLPSKYYYKLTSENKYAPSLEKTPFNVPSTKEIAWSYSEIDESILKITLHDAKTEVPTQRYNDAKNYLIRNQFNNKLNVDVYRSDNKTLLLSTIMGPMIFSSEHLELSLELTENYLFGLGETYITLEKDSNLTKVIYGNNMDHNSLPIFIAKQSNQFHGVKVQTDGILEVTVLPSNLIILKAFRASQIELELHVGPTIQDVVSQQSREIDDISIITEKLFGIHICREGNSWDVDEMLKEYQEQNRNIPFESDCIHSNLFHTLLYQDKNITDKIDTTSPNLALALPPQVITSSKFYEDVKQIISFYNNKNNSEYHGKYYGKLAAYPYFENEAANKEYAASLQNEITTRIGLAPKYFALYNNWPVDESFLSSDLEDLLYVSEEMRAATLLTLPWYTQISNITHLKNHNNYASLQFNLIKNNLLATSTDSFIITSGHNFGTTGAVLIQNIDISWTNFALAIKKMLYNSVFGSPLVVIPACGSTSNYNVKLHEALCIRWYIMTSTSPIFLISSDKPRRDPYSLNTLQATHIVEKVINIRDMLVFYIYSVFKEKQPLTRPLFYEFPNDLNGYTLNTEYMMGSNILVAHPVLPDSTQLKIYLPESINVWYEIWGGTAYDRRQYTNGTIQISLMESDWVGFISAGRIVPLKITNGASTYIKPIVALDDVNKAANGILWIDSVRFELSATNETLTITKTNSDILQNPMLINNIVLYSQNGRKNIICGSEINFVDISNSISIKFDSCLF